MDEDSLKRKNKATVNLTTGRFDNIDSAVIISSAAWVMLLLVVRIVNSSSYSFALPCIHC